MSFLPSRIKASLLQCSASSMMCVDTMRVTPSLLRSWKYFQSSHLNCGSTPTVGSSKKSSFGRWTSTQAMEARFRMPPEMVLTVLFCRPERRVISRISSSAFPAPLTPDLYGRFLLVAADDEEFMYIPPISESVGSGMTSRNPFVLVLASAIFHIIRDRTS